MIEQIRQYHPLYVVHMGVCVAFLAITTGVTAMAVWNIFIGSWTGMRAPLSYTIMMAVGAVFAVRVLTTVLWYLFGKPVNRVGQDNI